MSAIISECGTYRYRLERSSERDFWLPKMGRIVNFIMLNPSTADAIKDDPTIRRCKRFARDWGFDTLIVTNLFAFRATDPQELRFTPDPVGPDNDKHILEVARHAHLIVYAWGKEGGYRGRGDEVRAMLRGTPGVAPASLIKTTKDGLPCHPLYLEANRKPIGLPQH